MTLSDSELLAKVAAVEGWPEYKPGRFAWDVQCDGFRTLNIVADPLNDSAQAFDLMVKHRIAMTFSNSGNVTAGNWMGQECGFHGTTAAESDEDYMRGVRRAILLAIAAKGE